MHRRPQAQFLDRGGRGPQDISDVRIGGGKDPDEFGETGPNILDEVHAPLRSSSLWTMAMACSVCRERGPRPMTSAPRSDRRRVSSGGNSWLSESTKVASAGRSAVRISLPPSPRDTNGGPSRSSASPNVTTELTTPGADS